jgi:hypothetical protein
MVRQAEPIEIAAIADAATLGALAEDVQRSRIPRLLTRDGEPAALLSPPPRRAKSPRPQQNNALLRLLAIADSGAARSSDPTDISTNKHRYLAQALAAEATSAEQE